MNKAQRKARLKHLNKIRKNSRAGVKAKKAMLELLMPKPVSIFEVKDLCDKILTHADFLDGLANAHNVPTTLQGTSARRFQCVK